MELPTLSFRSYTTHFQEFILEPSRAREEDRVLAYILSIAIGIFSLAAIHSIFFVMKLFHKTPETFSECDKKTDQKAREIITSSANQEASVPTSPDEVHQLDGESDNTSLKKHHRAKTSLEEFFSSYAVIPEESEKTLQKVSTIRLHRRPRFVGSKLNLEPTVKGHVSIEEVPESIATFSTKEPANQLTRTQSEIVKKIKKEKNLSLSLPADVSRILQHHDPLLTESILNKLDKLISTYRKTWKKEKKDVVLSYPVSIEVFIDIYYHAQTKKIVIATQQFASGMYNEIITGYDWDNGHEVVCSRRIPTESSPQALIEASEKRFEINKALNRMEAPGIIEVKHLLKTEKLAVIISEKMKGCELQEFLENKDLAKPLSQLQKIHLFFLFVKTMDFLHEKKITHGDISPRNLFVEVTEKGEIKTKLFDFDKSEKFETKKQSSFISASMEDTMYMGKLLYGLIFLEKLKGEEISHKEMKKNLPLPDAKVDVVDSLESICAELLHVSKDKKTNTLSVSLADIKKRLKKMLP